MNSEAKLDAAGMALFYATARTEAWRDVPRWGDLQESTRALWRDEARRRLPSMQNETGEESAAIPASDSTVPPGDGAAACKG